MPRNGYAASSQPDMFHPETWTSGTSGTCALTTSEATPAVTSSQASPSGITLSGSRVGLRVARSGPDPVLANLSARRAAELGLLTSGTSGRTGTTSSESVALQRSLESRLRALAELRGSTWFKMTWKRRATPSRRSISALSAETISGSGYGFWPTPMAGTPPQKGYNAAGNTDSSRRTVWLARGASTSGWSAETDNGALLNPAHYRSLMHIPAAWDECAPTATPSTRKPRQRSSKPVSALDRDAA